MEEVQASEDEVTAQLGKLEACLIDGEIHDDYNVQLTSYQIKLLFKMRYGTSFFEYYEDIPSGCWRMLDSDFKGKVLEHIFSLREENGWKWDSIPLAPCYETLNELYDK